jgi:hypothetical protein
MLAGTIRSEFITGPPGREWQACATSLAGTGALRSGPGVCVPVPLTWCMLLAEPSCHGHCSCCGSAVRDGRRIAERRLLGLPDGPALALARARMTIGEGRCPRRAARRMLNHDPGR